MQMVKDATCLCTGQCPICNSMNQIDATSYFINGCYKNVRLNNGQHALCEEGPADLFIDDELNLDRLDIIATVTINNVSSNLLQIEPYVGFSTLILIGANYQRTYII